MYMPKFSASPKRLYARILKFEVAAISVPLVILAFAIYSFELFSGSSLLSSSTTWDQLNGATLPHQLERRGKLLAPNSVEFHGIGSFHTAPPLSKWCFTFCYSSATRLTCSGRRAT